MVRTWPDHADQASARMMPCMTPEEFRVAGHVLVDWIADHRRRIPDLPVASRVSPGEVAAGVAEVAPEHPEPLAQVLADLDRVVVPGVTQTQSPDFFGWFPSNASLASVLGDLASGGLGALGITWASAPALTEVEEVVTDWLRDLTGLSAAWRGAIHDTASSACLVALLAAREQAGGLHGGAPLVVYASTQAHSSVDKAAILAGYDRRYVRYIEVDEAYALRPDALAAAIAADVAEGRRPAAIVASVGTTGTTAVDPVASIVQIAARYGVWVHVDAAMAGAALLLPEMRWLGDGVEGADSFSWNPHKWLGTILDTSLLYVRDPGALVRVMSSDPSYLRSATDGQVTQYRDWGIPLGRRFRALKLWFHLRLDGVAAIRARLRRDLDNARWLAAQVIDEPGWDVVAPVVLQTVCVRHAPVPELGGDALDRHTLDWAARVNDSGLAFVTPSLLDGGWMVRVSIGAESTERHHVHALWQLMRDAAAGRAMGSRPEGRSFSAS